MNLESKIFNGGLVKCAVNECNGELHPIIFSFDYSKNATLMNPSIFNDNGLLRVCVRGTNYTMHHSEYGKFPHWGSPLQYIHPENDVRLATENYIIDLDDDLEITKARYVDMKLNVQPQWEFHGLEDARLIRWEGRLYLCGVRRDTTPNGQGRMELSEIELTDDTAIEISRNRIPTFTEAEYCEKNWMPILDKPYYYMKWSNPVEVVSYDITARKLVAHPEYNQDPYPKYQNIRGGSQLVPYKDYYIAFTHSMNIWKPYAGEKDAEYWNHIAIWDKNLKLLKVSDPFKFINSAIEFCCGACIDNGGKLVVSFSECDNVPFLLRLDPDWLINKIFE